MSTTRRICLRKKRKSEIFKRVKYNHQYSVTQEALDAELLRTIRSASPVTRVRTLLSRGAQVNCTDSLGYTPLLLALTRSHGNNKLELVSTLCSYGAEMNLASDLFFGDSPLHLACGFEEENSEDIIRTLLKFGANVHSTNFSGHAPLHVAAVRGNADAMRLLILHGADVNATELYCGYTPLHLAANGCHEDAMLLLVECGANIRWLDFMGFTPIGRCRSRDVGSTLTEKYFRPRRLEKICSHVVRDAVRNARGLEGYEDLPLPKKIIKSRIKLEFYPQ